MPELLRKTILSISFETLEKLADDYNFIPEYDMTQVDFKKSFGVFLMNHNMGKEFIARANVLEVNKTNNQKSKIRLFPFQIPHKRALIEGLQRHGVVIDSSDTGAGKTYVGLSITHTERRPLVVICPKSMVADWYLLSLQFNIQLLVICNYDTFIKGKMYIFKENGDLDDLERVENPYVKRIEKKGRGKSTHVSFEWSLPERTHVIYDEAHNCKNMKAIRTQLLISLYEYARLPENQWKEIVISLLSATIIENYENLRPFLYVLGLTNDINDNNYFESNKLDIRDLGRKFIVERRMSRMSLKEAKLAIGDKHTSDICTKMFTMSDDDQKEIEQLNVDIRTILLAEKEKKPKNHLALRIKNRKRIETLKLQILFNETIIQRNNGYSVVIFVNFKDSLATLKKMLEDKTNENCSIIIGGQKAGERLKEVTNFQSGITKILIAIIDTGGTGISLHDLQGGYPRYTLISPPESATKLIQALGRVNRIGSKSNSVQRIIFVAGTIEEKIAESVNNKIRTIGELNTGDKADNLFLFEVYHQFNQSKSDAKQAEKKKIEVIVNRRESNILVIVPEYMKNIFEQDIPHQVTSDMKILDGCKYQFPLKHNLRIRSYLESINR